MSKQQGQSPGTWYQPPDENQEGKKVPKKVKGKYELWMRHNPKYTEYAKISDDWYKMRTYRTMKLAEQNLRDQDRKWNASYPDGQKDAWQFEIRIKDN